MKDILLNTQNDIDVNLNNFRFAEEYVYIQQKLNIRLRLVQGEWFLDSTKGLPYFTDMLGKENIDGANIEALFKREILNTIGVDEITSFDMNLSSARQLTVQFSVNTDLGELTSEVTI